MTLLPREDDPPIAPAPPDFPIPAAPPEPPIHPAPPDGGRRAGRRALRILILEDQDYDAELAARLLTRAGFDLTAVVVDTGPSFAEQLAGFAPEVILSDHNLPGFSGESALELARQQCPDVPFIVMSGELGDEAAVDLLSRGATDYVLKDRPARLPSAVRRALAEAELRAQQARVQAELYRSRLATIGRLAGGIAHQFNNQVGAMLNYAAFIREAAAERDADAADGEAWDGVRRDAEQIERAGQRVIAVVHQLLEAGSQEIVRNEPVDLNQVVSALGELLRRTIDERGDMRLRLAPRLWPVTADPAQLQQVLVNLTLNAGEAMSDGDSFTIETGNVQVSHAEARDHAGLTPGRYVRLIVRDTGAGMPPETLKQALEPFFTTKSFAEGRGLGLASVNGIVSQAGGTVGIASAPGAGTTVTVWLPATV